MNHITNQAIINKAISDNLNAQQAYAALRNDGKKLNLRRRMELDSTIKGAK